MSLKYRKQEAELDNISMPTASQYDSGMRHEKSQAHYILLKTQNSGQGFRDKEIPKHKHSDTLRIDEKITVMSDKTIPNQFRSTHA